MAVETARPRERAGLEKRARARRRRGWGRAWHKEKVRRQEGQERQERAEALRGVFTTLTPARRGGGFGAGRGLRTNRSLQADIPESPG